MYEHQKDVMLFYFVAANGYKKAIIFLIIIVKLVNSISHQHTELYLYQISTRQFLILIIQFVRSRD